MTDLLYSPYPPEEADHLLDGMETTQYMSKAKLDALKKEYADLKEVKIPAVAKRIDDARQMGDLSENAEYHTAREELAWAQSRVKELEYIFDHAEVVGAKSADGVVSLGSHVTVLMQGAPRVFTIVGAQEADPAGGKISNESPLGQAFLGKRKGEAVSVTTPKGMQAYEIIEIA